jgi:dTMP kinase
LPFVSIDGIDGSGKTTQVRLLCSALEAEGKNVVRTKEPDGGRLGFEVRAMLTKENRSLSRIEELLLVSASRYDHVRSVVRPALKAGDWVVSDRFVDSTFAFQAYGDDGLTALFKTVTSLIVDDSFPDFTFILDLPEDAAVIRRDGRYGGGADPSEATRDFGTIRAGFLEAARLSPNRCHVVNAGGKENDVAARIWEKVQPNLGHGYSPN